MKQGSGPMIKKITIDQATDSPDGMGGFTRSWTTFHTTYADIKPLTANEQFFAHQVRGVTTHKIRIRFKAGITAAMQVKYVVGGSTRTFQIHGVINEDERNRYMTLLCKEGVGS